MALAANNITSRPIRLNSRPLGHVTILIALLIISVGINVGLATKVGQLRNAVETLKDEGKLKVNTLVPAIQAKMIDGETASISYTDSNMPTILYIFSPQCHWCALNLENTKALYQGTSGKYRFLSL